MFYSKSIANLENQLEDIETKLIKLNNKINFFERTNEYLEDNSVEFYNLFLRLFDLTTQCYNIEDTPNNFENEYLDLIKKTKIVTEIETEIKTAINFLKYDTLHSNHLNKFTVNKELQLIHTIFMCWKQNYKDSITKDKDKANEFYSLVCYTLEINPDKLDKKGNLPTVFIRFYSKLVYKYLSDIVELLRHKQLAKKHEIESKKEKREFWIAFCSFFIGFLSSILGNIISDKLINDTSYKVITNIEKIEIISNQNPISTEKIEKDIGEIKAIILKSSIKNTNTSLK